MTATQMKAPLVEVQRDDDIIDADIKAAAEEATALLKEIQRPISSQAEFEFIQSSMQQLASKGKFLDDERKVSTAPLNDEVNRINDWYRPATTAIKNLVEQAKRVLAEYVLKQQREAQRLAAEAEAKAKAALAANTSTAPAVALMTQSAQAKQSVEVQKGAPVSHKVVWAFRIKDPASLPRAFLMPDEAKIKEHVAKHGNKDVPAGVEVYEDVSFRVSKK